MYYGRNCLVSDPSPIEGPAFLMPYTTDDLSRIVSTRTRACPAGIRDISGNFGVREREREHRHGFRAKPFVGLG